MKFQNKGTMHIVYETVLYILFNGLAARDINVIIITRIIIMTRTILEERVKVMVTIANMRV